MFTQHRLTALLPLAGKGADRLWQIALDEMADIEDLDQLELELNYQPRSGFRRQSAPPGYSIMMAMAALLFCFGFTLGGAGSLWVLGKSQFNQFLALGMGLVAGLVPAAVLPRLFWRGIGSAARKSLRPLGCLGAAPLIFAVLVALALTFHHVQSLRARLPKSPIQGRDWKVLTEAASGGNLASAMTIKEARAACRKLGPDWHLVRLEDLSFVQKNVTTYHWRGCHFHLDDTDAPRYLAYQKLWKVCQEEVGKGGSRRQVLCLRRPDQSSNR